MKSLFIDEMHETRYYTLVNMDHTADGDREREAMFYILSGNKELFNHVHYIYSCQAHRLRPNPLHKLGYMCRSSKNLLRLSLHLYNSNIQRELSPCDILNNLDSDNLTLALNGMLLRFS